MELWRKVWRQGLAPQLSRAALRSLREALKRDDPHLLQGRTTFPACVLGGEELAVEGCCALAWCGWQAEGLASVGAVTEYWDRLCFEADAALGEPGICKAFLDWHDATPRPVWRRELLREINRLLSRRRQPQLEAA